MGNSRRLTRSDKKVDVKPTISENLKTKLYRLSETLDEPVKDVAERLCNDGCMNTLIIEEMQKWFRRDYHHGVTWTMGNQDRPRLRIHTDTHKGKVTIKFKQKDYNQICKLAFALDITPTTTCAVLLMLTLRGRQFMQWYLGVYGSKLDEMKLREVYKILKI